MDGRQSRSLEGLDYILVKIYQSLFHKASFVDGPVRCKLWRS